MTAAHREPYAAPARPWVGAPGAELGEASAGTDEAHPGNSRIPGFATRVKKYYIDGELYDWVTDPRRFEVIFHGWRARATLRVCARHANAAVVADVGCGTGLVTRALFGRAVVGVDINRWNLQQAVSHRPDFSVVQGDAEQLPLRSGSLETVVCTETLEHLVEPRKALLEMLRVLKPGGKLIGSVPSRSWIWKTRRYMLSTCPGSEPFHNNYSVTDARAMLTLADSEILELSRGVFGLSMFFVLQKYADT